ncbi:flap endonuclease GEN-like isoform X2 [Sycon ciliatum]|uniref:flap endonuclease GEN-like isoform X2 n=1 Tax=Sycon ciliatum TaxID=27933 RepID=UPI0031F69513
MGVLTLWPMLEAAREVCDLQVLSGKTLAVDLSGWICEACALRATIGKINKPHLRTLFFRVAQLCRLDVKLVFVCDGNAVELKYETISKRIDARNGRTSGQATGSKTKKKCSRTQLNRRVKECVDLLSCLGIPTIKANGEAEALCALLDAAGLVDGCITEDGDAFLYGAKVIYRGLSTSSKEMEVSRYSMSQIEDKLGLNRRKLVSLAILLGCDYLPHGIPGVGKETALKLLQCVHGDILDRFNFWTRCRGKSSEITDTIESRVCRKALDVSGFPFPEVTNEYLTPDEALPPKAFSWVRPRLHAACDMLSLLLEWPEQYAWDKVFPLLANWHLKVTLSPPTLLQAHTILKTCVRAGVPCYEVAWRGSEAQRPRSLDDAATATASAAGEPDWMISIEHRDLVEKCHPKVVDQFVAQQECLKKAKKAGARQRKNTEKKKKGAEATTSTATADKENTVPESAKTELTTEPLQAKSASSGKVAENAGVPLPGAASLPAVRSLRDRLKRPAAPAARETLSQRGVDPTNIDCVVASTNPFKLHDESLEVIKAQGFDYALADLDAPMANISLTDSAATNEYSPDVIARASEQSTSNDYNQAATGMAASACVRRCELPYFDLDLSEDLTVHCSEAVQTVAHTTESPAPPVCESRAVSRTPPAAPAPAAYMPLAERLRGRRNKAVNAGKTTDVTEKPTATAQASANHYDGLIQTLDDRNVISAVTNSSRNQSSQVITNPYSDTSHSRTVAEQSSVHMHSDTVNVNTRTTTEPQISLDDSYIMTVSTPLQPRFGRPRAMSVDSPAEMRTMHRSPFAGDTSMQAGADDDQAMDMTSSFTIGSPWRVHPVEESFGLSKDAQLLASLASATPAEHVQHYRQLAYTGHGASVHGMSTPTAAMSPCLPRVHALKPTTKPSPMSDSMKLDVGLLTSLADGSPMACGSTRAAVFGLEQMPAYWGSCAKPIVID